LQQGARKIPTDSCEEHVVEKQSDKDNEENKLSRLAPRREAFHQLWRQPRRIDHHCRRFFSGSRAICRNCYIVQCVCNTATKTFDGSSVNCPLDVILLSRQSVQFDHTKFAAENLFSNSIRTFQNEVHGMRLTEA